MASREARTKAQAVWRANTSLKKIEAYLDRNLVAKLDEIVKDGGYKGRGEALAALIREYDRSLHVNHTPTKAAATKPLHVDRKADTKRCECRTAKGGRCKGKVVAIIKKRVGDHVMEFGACRRHEYNFTLPDSP